MRKPVNITGPALSLDEIAAVYGISKKRQTELLAILARTARPSSPSRHEAGRDTAGWAASKKRSVRKKPV